MPTTSLPTFRSVPALALAAIATVLACALLYHLPQRWYIGTPALLPFTFVDRLLPFWPWSGVLYFAVFPLLLGTFLSLRDFGTASRFLYASLLAQVIGAGAFLLWPTVYPRESFPLPAGTSHWAAALVAFCRGVDAPLNCLPSLHVSTVTLCLATLRYRTRWGRRASALLLALGLAIIASTMTFKQHYLLDVIAGAALGTGSWGLCFRQRDASA